MHDFEALVGELLSSRPELTREELMLRISEKKETVGAGYLTDQGALFLVAGEMGVTLQRSLSSDMPIKDLYVGANDVTTVARILAIHPTATYRKKDGGEGRYRRLVLFDGKHTTRLTLWDEKTGEIEKLRLEVGDPIKVQNAYVRQGLDGKPDLSLGKRGTLGVVPEAEIASRLATLTDVTEKLTETVQEKQFVSLECVVDSEPRFSEFVRSDGSPGSLFQFGVCDEDGKYRTRVVIWNPAMKPDLKKGQRVAITNLKSRRSSNGGYEIHGDVGSRILPGSKGEPAILRVVGTSGGSNGTIIVALEKSGKIRLVETEDGAPGLAKGDIVKIIPDFQSKGMIFCKEEGSIEVAKGIDFPSLQALVTKLKDAKDETAQIMVEVIALSHGNVEEIRLKDGSLVKRGELVVGDDTSEMRVAVWREQVEKLKGIQPGERIRISGVSPKLGRSGTWELGFNPATLVERLSGLD